MTYTKCADPACPEPLLQVTWVGQVTHPTCQQTAEELQLRAFVDAVQRGDQAEADRLEREVNNAGSIPSLGGVALWYASQGWPVFLLAPNGKQPLIAKRDGGNGLHDATTDLDQVREWWGQYPEANVGLPTGIKFDVIDIDGPDGIKSLAELGDDVLPEIHGKVSTPRGFHLYVLPTGDGNRAGVRPGIDYRGVGGYVCAPPSQIDFKRYTWVVKPSPQILGANG
nr:bifunctional DNA primase/polymerase [Mycolicibacterium sp. BK634]